MPPLKFVLPTFLLLICAGLLQAQKPAEHRSIHQIESEFYAAHPELVGRAVVPPLAKRPELEEAVSLSNVVYGFHPYWQNGSEANYYFSLLTHLAYFSGDVDTATGGFSNTHSWSSASVVSTALSYGVKVHFTITLFGGHSALLGNTTKENNLISSILTQVNLRGAQGCNVDFEAVSAGNANAFRTFIKRLGDSLQANGKELVVELPAVDWSSVYNSTFFSTTSPVVDYYFLMAYDYWWGGSSTAGPVAPLSGGTYNVTNSISSYLAKGLSAAKLIAGFPYYGFDWPVVSSDKNATTTGTGNSRTYTVVKTNYIDTISVSDQFFDATYKTPWYRYQSGGWRQCWYDDSASLSMKYDLVKSQSLGGTGMWALGYDGTYPELWQALKGKFASSPNPAFTTIADFESSVGVFNRQPTYSGSTVGILVSSTSARSSGEANNGWASLQVVLKDSTSDSRNWTVRLLSGTGSRSNNQLLSPTGYIGFWMKTASAPSGAQVAVTIDDRRFGSSDETELSTKVNVISDGEWHLYEWNFAAAGWTSFSNGNGTFDSTNVTLDAIMFYAPNASPDWTFYLDDVSYNSAGPLPVKLLAFEAVAAVDSVVLTWRTENEFANYGFEVERSIVQPSGETWEVAGFVPGQGTSTTPQDYSYVDHPPLDGDGARIRYRLRQINTDGSSLYSAAAEVSISATIPETIVLSQNYPNPFNYSTTVEFRLPRSGRATMTVYDLIGREVAVLFDEFAEAGTRYAIPFDASGLPSGVYVCALTAGGSQAVRKMTYLK